VPFLKVHLFKYKIYKTLTEKVYKCNDMVRSKSTRILRFIVYFTS
jgi:hypothetical protein